MSKRDLKYILFFNSAAILRNLIGVIRSKLISLWFGVNGVGVLGQLTTIYSTQSQLSDFGLFAYLVNRIGKINKDEEVFNYLQILFYSVTLLFLTNLAIFAGGFFFREQLSLLVFNSVEYAGYIALLLIIIPLYNFSYFTETLVRSHKKFKRLAIGQNLAGFIGVLSVAPLIWIWGIKGVIYNLIVFLIAYGSFFAWASREYIPLRKLYQVRPQAQILIDIFRFCSVVMGRKILAFFSILIFRIFIVQFSGLEANGYFQSVYSISNYVSILLNGFIVYLFPVLSSIDDLQTFNEQLNIQLEYLVYLIFPAIAVIIFIPDIMLLLLFSADFQVMSGYLKLFALAKLLEVVYAFYVIALLSQTRLRSFFTIEAIKSFLWIGIAFFAVQEYQLKGIMWTYVFIQAAAFLVVLYFARSEEGFRPTSANLYLIGALILSGSPLLYSAESIVLRLVQVIIASVIILSVLDWRKYRLVFQLFQRD